LLFARQQAFLDPYGEESHRRIMHLLLHSGRRKESLAHYENFRAAPGKELGLEPEDETRQLFLCI